MCQFQVVHYDLFLQKNSFSCCCFSNKLYEQAAGIRYRVNDNLEASFEAFAISSSGNSKDHFTCFQGGPLREVVNEKSSFQILSIQSD